MGDPIVERLTAVEVGLATLGETVGNGFEKVDRRMEGFQSVLMEQQKAIGVSAGRMNQYSNPGHHGKNESSKSTNRELDRIWKFVQLPFAGLVGGLVAQLLDRIF